ncbi:hypothetical protein [Atopococcus tabaci]|uniref:hypothetical protein n=1 Tax=Atopococcus tabaci TaxID=269774 RepID=UPI0003F9FF60|nr:hypothetical protein [Atopococcus tabaci]
MRKTNTLKWTLSGLLIALGIVIPMFSPVKILLEPASFTLASHVPIFFAMFLSPSIALYVALGTTAGFLLAGFPIVVSLRALSHVLFVAAGSWILKNNHSLLEHPGKKQLFSFVIGLIHAVSEVLVVTFFYYGGGLPEANYTNGFFYSVILLVGIGTLLHSMVDFVIAQTVWAGLGRQTQKMKKALQ